MDTDGHTLLMRAAELSNNWTLVEWIIQQQCINPLLRNRRTGKSARDYANESAGPMHTPIAKLLETAESMWPTIVGDVRMSIDIYTRLPTDMLSIVYMYAIDTL
jgi:hypothetical protein